MYLRTTSRKFTVPTTITISSESQINIDTSSTRKLPFGRKQEIDDRSPSKDCKGKLTRKSREGRQFQRENSLDRVKSAKVNSGGKDSIKYLSPHFARTNNFTSPPQKNDQGINQKFSRKPMASPETFRERFISHNVDESKPTNIKSKDGVQYSLESILTKNTEHSEFQLGTSNWFSLQTENEVLRRQKERLENEVQVLRELLRKASIEMPQIETLSSMKQSNCSDRQNSLLGSQTCSLLKAKMSEFQRKEHQLICKLKQEEIQTDLLRQELLEVTKQLETETMAKFDLMKLVQNLRAQISHERTALEKNVVKQDMLLRQRAEYEGAKKLASKADRERQIFKKTIGEYKEKITVLTNILVKNRKKKEQEVEMSLDLSMSIDSY